MSARDELGGILETMEGPLLHIADAILAAGYRKPRTITTVEELDALLHGDANVILMDSDGVALQNLVGGWNTAGSPSFMSSDLAFHVYGPTFTVLHEVVEP